MAFTTEDNILNSIGEVAVFRTTPLWFLGAITTLTENITGVTGTRTVEKTFRYTLDGIVYTDWYTLSQANLIAEINPNLTNKTTCLIELSYKRTGTDPTGQIEIVSTDITGTYLSAPVYPTGSANYTYREYIENDDDVFNLMVNLVQKVYEVGIIPTYLVRDEKEFDIFEDKDYIDFWSSIAKMFAVLYKFSLKFTMIYWNKELLCEYLRQKTIQFCDCSDLELLQQIASHYYDEIRQRGTIEIFRPKDFEYPFGYRSRYVLPDPFTLSATNPIWINDVRYTDNSNLPYGWNVLCFEEVQLGPAPGTQADIKITFDYMGGTVDFLMDNIPMGWFYSSPLARLIKPCDDGYVAIAAEYVPGPTPLPFTINHGICLYAPDENYYQVEILAAPVIVEDGIDDLPRVDLVLTTVCGPTHYTSVKKQHNGEYLRLICYNFNCDEFMFNIVNKENAGWNIGNASPLWKSLRNHNNNTIIKGYESFSEDVWDLRYYPII